MSRTRWIQCRGCHKLILESEYAAHIGEGEKGKSANVLSDITPFLSPVSGKLVGSRSALRAHNKKHKVVNFDDWGNQGELNRKEAEKVFKAGHPDRIESIRKAIYQNTGEY
tara:strand:- start:30073 stop:30405 length:333 start_codon:yes stop_codon:yes gene_type:complete